MHFGKFPSGDISDAEDDWASIRQNILDLIKATHVDVSSILSLILTFLKPQKQVLKPIWHWIDSSSSLSLPPVHLEHLLIPT